mgnify:CR=1 FL=1
MSNCRIFPFNRWSDTTLGTISSSGEIAAYPASNTQKQQISKMWRSSGDPASTNPNLSRDLGSAFRISSACIVAHNLTKDGQFRVRVSNNSDMSSPLYDSGFLYIWTSFLPTASEFSDGTGRPNAALIKLLEFCSENPRVTREITFTEVTGRYIQVDFQDSTNTDGFIQISYVYAGLYIELDDNVAYGWEIMPESVNRIHRAASGQFWIDLLYTRLRANANAPTQGEVITVAFWEFMFSLLGVTKEWIISIRDTRVSVAFWVTFLCHFPKVPRTSNPAIRRYGIPIEVEELVG